MMRATTAHQKNCVFARIGPLDQCVLNDKSLRKRLRRVRVRSWACSPPSPILTARRIHRFAAAVAAVPTSSSSVGMESGRPWTDKV